MAIIDELRKLTPQSAPVAEAPQQDSWVQNLINTRYEDKTERLKRTPVGFDFKRDPFDPSSYYKQLQQMSGISKGATAVAEQIAAFQANQRREDEAAASKTQVGAALGGVAANFVANGVSRKYGLKRVSSNTAKAADFWGSKYGIKNIGGYAAHGSVPGSDHPKGRALDFMINNIKNGKATGTALANDLIRNYKKWNIKYVIWNRYIWTPSRGWHRYSGPSPHTDHVHASFNK